MEPTSSTPEPSPTAPPVPATSLAGRLVNVLAAPGEVFDGIKTAPPRTAHWLVPAILFILISWAGAGLVFLQPAIQQQVTDLADRAIDQRVEKGKISGAEAEKAKPMVEKMARISSIIGAVAGPPLVAFAGPFWWGLILWLGGKVLKGNFSYLKAVEVAGLTNVILVLDAVVRTLLILVTGSLFASPSLALAIKDFDPQNTLHGLCALVNVMLFWMLAVRSVGLARLSGASLGKAALWIFGIWIAYTGTLVGLGAALRAILPH